MQSKFISNQSTNISHMALLKDNFDAFEEYKFIFSNLCELVWLSFPAFFGFAVV
jgi:hypothetical protein